MCDCGGEYVEWQEHRNQVAQAQVERAQKQKEPEPLQHEEARPDIHTDGIDMVGGRDVVQDAAPLKPEPHAVPRATSTAQKHEDAPVDHSNPDLSEVAADAEAMEFNKDRDFVDNAPRDFSVDEPVEVWSDHHNEWSAARVTSVHAAGQHAALVTCRLAGADRQLQTLFSKSPLLRKVAEGAGGVKSPTVAKFVGGDLLPLLLQLAKSGLGARTIGCIGTNHCILTPVVGPLL